VSVSVKSKAFAYDGRLIGRLMQLAPLLTPFEEEFGLMALL